ncbi:hypothetical protein QJQ45_012107 [Haematococcus lacustris]|nr:hypothetical protein QJQ45_012107 [Haematococcus lacustris]
MGRHSLPGPSWLRDHIECFTCRIGGCEIGLQMLMPLVDGNHGLLACVLDSEHLDFQVYLEHSPQLSAHGQHVGNGLCVLQHPGLEAPGAADAADVDHWEEWKASQWKVHPFSREEQVRAEAEAQAARLRVARGIQMQAMKPPAGVAVRRTPATSSKGVNKPVVSSKPSSSKPPSSKPAAGSKGPAAGAANSKAGKTCAQCAKPTSGLPLRCSGCKQVYYCTQACQKKAWPEHKEQCKASTSPPGTGPNTASTSAANGATVSPTSSSKTAAVGPSTPDEPAGQEPASTKAPGLQSNGSDGSAAEAEPSSFHSALAHYLEEAAASKTDQLEAAFERSVMLFVKGEYRAAITSLERAQALAVERGDVGVQGEVFKWLGHAHNRLSDTAKAQAFFEQGAEFARQHNQARLEIDCLGGLGVMYRNQNQAAKAVELLETALALCEKSEDMDSKASTLCNLGAAMMQVDQVKALNHLNQAVDIREQAVGDGHTALVLLDRLTAAGQRDGLATAVMEHANALVNLASALFVTKRHAQAKVCFERALEVFEVLEDVDKVAKVLINLANMAEIHVSSPQAYKEAAEYRKRLLAFLQEHGVRRMDSQCSICLEPMAVQEVTRSHDKELIMLACLHTLHNACWEKLVSTKAEDIACPTCKQPVPLFS